LTAIVGRADVRDTRAPTAAELPEAFVAGQHRARGSGARKNLFQSRWRATLVDIAP
jgi:hypothetical protein